MWVPDWPVTAAGFTATDAAVVVFANRVVACSAAARTEGVRRGLRRREAQGRCPSVTVVEYDADRDARAFEPVVAAVESLTPRVEIVRPGLCVFDTRGPSRYFGGDEELARRIARLVPSANIGIADGPFAAVIASRMDLIVPPGESPSFLAPFPVSSLERPELVDLLRRLGVRTLGAFAALPAIDVLARFGPDGALAHRLASGLDDRPLDARTPPPDLTFAMELDPPAEQVDRAAFAARHLAHELHEELARRGLACTRIAIEAETEHGEFLSRLWRHDGALTPGMIAERVRWQVDGWLHRGEWADRPTSGISLLRLVPDQVGPDGGTQHGFWGGRAIDDRISRALARVQGMLGPEAVVTAACAGGRGPAEQMTLVPWGDARDDAGAPAPWPGAIPSPAPAVVRTAPCTVVDKEGVPVGVTGRGLVTATPAQLNNVDIAGWAGPWPVDERWWDPPAHRRRARFQVATVDGRAYLVALERGQWFIEATYD
ncbi:MAG TPA: DNA polymerase Y family protein [Acidimicrobiales bacterium]|nr:DNA polymerase Y family protein [Acidimicrobiales bacterium]